MEVFFSVSVGSVWNFPFIFVIYRKVPLFFKVVCVRIKSNIQQKVNFLCFLWKYNCKDLFVNERLIMIEEHLDDPDSVLSYI